MERAVRLPDGRSRITREQERILGVARPRGERGIDIGADGDENDVLAVFEELCVLITVRIHLDRSATRSRFEEEREHDRLPLEVAEPRGILQRTESGRAWQREVRRDGADRECRWRRWSRWRSGGGCWLLHECGNHQCREHDTFLVWSISKSICNPA